MAKVFFALTLLGLLLSPPFLSAEPNNEAAPTYVMCRNKKLVRTVRVKPASGDVQCETTYTKAGIDKVVGYGRNDVSCFNILKNIKSNLEQAGWICRDISMTTVTRSTSAE